MQKHKNNFIKFQLVNITTEQFAVIEDAFDTENKNVSFSVNIDFGIDKEQKLIISNVKVQFEQNKSVFLIIEVSNQYIVDDTAWNEQINIKNKYIIPKGFATHLMVLTIGTLRGVLHAKTENTEFNRFILPTLNVSELIDSDIETEVQ